MNPLVSIVITTYNSEKHILSTLESVKNQTYNNIELIISDDCSTDNTLKLCYDWISLNRSRFEDVLVLKSSNNQGIPYNRNKGLRQATGEWIKPFDDDDILVKEALEIFINEVKTDKIFNKKIYHGKVIEFGSNKNILSVNLDFGEQEFQDFNSNTVTAYQQSKILLRFCPIYAPTVFIHRSIFSDVGYYDERFLFWDDRPMWFKITSAGIKFHFVNQVIAKYRRHESSIQMTSSKLFFSRTRMSMDKGYTKVFLQHLPFHERILNIYIFKIRKVFFLVSKNRKSLILNIIYKGLTYIPEKMLRKVRLKHHP